jgi:hypothetical protein
LAGVFNMKARQGTLVICEMLPGWHIFPTAT